jgi:hypothetical protein
MEFWTTLLCVDNPDAQGTKALQENCTHVLGPWWIMEGETDYLRDEGVRFEEIAEGAVGALGGLSLQELLKIVKDSYGIALRSLRDPKPEPIIFASLTDEDYTEQNSEALPL